MLPRHRADAERRRLRDALRERMAVGGARPWSEPRFAELALEVFRYQAGANPVYGTFVENRGIRPAEVEDWREIPTVPARAFKELPLVSGDPDRVERVFRTSGTTRGDRVRGAHHVRDLSLYRDSLLAAARAFLRPDRGAGAAAALRVLALLPAPETRPESSLVYMAGTLAEAWDDGGGGFFADPSWELRHEALGAALDRTADAGLPVLVVGTAFAFVRWLDVSLGRRRTALPEGSRVMETGGFKGRSREVPRAELYEGIEETLGVPVDRIVNEYGMTELLSQFYEPVLRGDCPEAPHARWHRGPPWVRTRILHPETLEPAAPGEPGLLCHLDLANLDSVAAVLTEDLGVEAGEGFRVLGRAAGAEARGCSLTMEEVLEAGGGGR